MNNYKFADLFSGCGGLSLGLSMAGLQGQFVIERDTMAFDTFSDNLLSERSVPAMKFDWPSWLERRAWSIDDLLEQHRERLTTLQGSIQVLAGGPPCQGFSFAGRRDEEDPRNKLFEKYVEVVEALKPPLLILENVPGMKVAHTNSLKRVGARDQLSESYFDKLKRQLENIGYQVHGQIIDASRFGVPQRRNRLIVVGVESRLASNLDGGVMRVFELLEASRGRLLSKYGLSGSAPIAAQDAISDLLVRTNITQPCVDPLSPKGFREVAYTGPKTPYQKAMHKHCRGQDMDSMRLARHKEEVKERFARIIQECQQGVQMNGKSRALFGLKKQRIYPMSAWEPAPTITTLPDDVVHYSEPRILTVRESARLQSFPDWFRFSGKYTTGGAMRVKECPRYTQVGNAVPPLLAEAIGLATIAVLAELEKKLKVSIEKVAPKKAKRYLPIEQAA
jgi:DNA (cytosine-5)-methyltransferase 1